MEDCEISEEKALQVHLYTNPLHRVGGQVMAEFHPQLVHAFVIIETTRKNLLQYEF